MLFNKTSHTNAFKYIAYFKVLYFFVFHLYNINYKRKSHWKIDVAFRNSKLIAFLIKETPIIIKKQRANILKEDKNKLTNWFEAINIMHTAVTTAAYIIKVLLPFPTAVKIMESIENTRSRIIFQIITY